MTQKIGFLSPLATNQADEIVSAPTTHNAFPQLDVNGALSHSMNQPLSTDLRRALDARGIPNSLDEDGDLFFVVPTDEPGNPLLFWIMVEGEDSELVQIRCKLNVKIPQRKWPIVLNLINSYHMKFRFGRAVLDIREGQDEAALSFTAAVDCTGGVSQEFLQTLITSHISSAVMFYDMVKSTKTLAIARPKNNRKPTHHKE